jgi:N-methylhydantoinase B
MGFNPRTGRPFGDIHFMCKGGGGASQGRDGWNHIGTVVCAGGLRAPDPELHELVDPFTVLQYEYWPDSAGAGEWRGGVGTIYRWRIDTNGIPAANFGGGVHEVTAPFGLEGGHPAAPHQLRLLKGDKVIPVDAESFYDLDEGDVFEIHQSGGGGYGDPHRRAVETSSRMSATASSRSECGGQIRRGSGPDDACSRQGPDARTSRSLIVTGCTSGFAAQSLAGGE